MGRFDSLKPSIDEINKVAVFRSDKATINENASKLDKSKSKSNIFKSNKPKIKPDTAAERDRNMSAERDRNMSAERDRNMSVERNIFKSNPKVQQQQQQQAPNNLFKRGCQNAVNIINIINNVENFPDLNADNKIHERKVNIETDYLEKIKQKKADLQKEPLLLKEGWIVLSSNMSAMDQNPNNADQSNTNNLYYNPKRSYQIYQDRRVYRDNLNDMLGDISPYWNMDYYTVDNNDDEMDFNAGQGQAYSDHDQEEEQEWW